MAYLLDRDGVFEVRKSLQGQDSGNGVFAVEDVKAGTILPYYAVAFKESRAPGDMDRAYVISGDYNNPRGNPRTSGAYSVDGNPFVEPVASLEEYKKLGCQINEASRGSTVNALFTINPFLTKQSFKESLVNQEPIAATLVVVIEDVPAGTELLTMYGDLYSDRGYKVCRLKRKEHDRLVDVAYSFTDKLYDKSRPGGTEPDGLESGSMNHEPGPPNPPRPPDPSNPL
jgi:hypothetical protein